MRLELRPLVRDVRRAYSHHWRLLVPLALVVLLPQAIVDALFGDLEIDGIHKLGDVLKLLGIPLPVVTNLGGEALFAGILAAVVVEWRAGREFAGVRETLPTIPFGRLIVVDLVLVLGTAVGLLLLVVPGLLVYTYLVISPALVEVQHVTIRRAFTHSVELVRGNFWRVLGVSLFFLAATDAVGTVLEAPFHGLHNDIAFNLAIHAALEPFQGLATVLMALALIDIHRAGRSDLGPLGAPG